MGNLIIDTDLGFDCDDAGALAIANKLHNEGKIKILAVTHSVDKKIGGDAIRAVNDYYGNSSIPIGVAERYALDVDNLYEEFYAKFHYAEDFAGWSEKPTFYKIPNALNLGRYKNAEYPSAKTVIRNALEASEDKSVTVVCIGQANNIADFLDFDEELFLRKVKRVVVMCGNFTDYDKEYLLDGVYYKGEFNVTLDIRSMQRLFEEKNLPCFVLDFNQGVDVLSGDGLKSQIGNPVREAYKAHGNGVNFNLPSWDLMAVMFAVGRYDNLFTVGEKGTVGIDDNGKSTFEAGIGEHRLIYRAVSASEFANVINEKLASE